VEDDRVVQGRMLTALVAVAIAFADSSIVVLALPDLYGQLHTSINGVAWVVTSYNAAVAAMALVLIVFVHRLRAGTVLAGGLVVFLLASTARSRTASRS
jgi:predicted MFS family arabinose efflux permease